MHALRTSAVLGLLLVALQGCAEDEIHATPPEPSSPSVGSSATPKPSPTATPPAVAPPFRHPLPGMPPAIGNDVYAGTRAGMLDPKVARDPAYLYVPDSAGSTTTVISQRTHKVVRIIRSGTLSQHVNPSYDLRTLYADASAADRLVAINPRTARVERRIPVRRPYNVYFTPDGRRAVVMVEQHDAIRYVDPHTFQGPPGRQYRGCVGPNHLDFSANGRFFVVTCEFSGTLLKISTLTHRLLGSIDLGATSMPQDVRISPDGTTFYVAVMGRDRLQLVDAQRFVRVGRIATPHMPHGLMPSRDGRQLYVSDRGAGKISVVSFAERRIVDTWTIPGGGSPDMGAVSADGSMLWVSGRYDGVVYGFDTRRGTLVAQIPVGGSPHGLAVWPVPGRYSLGHTGNMR
ncbi:MAG: beta-propeller fold lactonase family protein [Nocardioidaceae bacterium]